ncbi:MAG: TorF family putative porin [Xanthobacteraceae bacterium]
MRKFALTAMTAAVTLMSASAMAADLKMAAKAAPPPPPPSPWDIAFGGYIASDYIWRGITQSNHKPSVSAYTEVRYNSSPTLQWYGGISGESISFPNQAAAEIDLYGGVRPTFGPLALDFGYWYYYYPGGTCYFGGAPGCLASPLGNFVAKSNWSFWEVYAKGVWTVNDQWALGFNVFGTSNILNTGASGTYVSGTVKYTAPASQAIAGSIGWYVSGEYGEQFLGTSDAFYGTGPGTVFAAGTPYVDYATWNVGLGFTWKVFTLDLRYYDTDLTKAECAVYTSDYTAGISPSQVSNYNPVGVTSNWCNARFVAKLAFDITLGALK